MIANSPLRTTPSEQADFFDQIMADKLQQLAVYGHFYTQTNLTTGLPTKIHFLMELNKEELHEPELQYNPHHRKKIHKQQELLATLIAIELSAALHQAGNPFAPGILNYANIEIHHPWAIHCISQKNVTAQT